MTSIRRTLFPSSSNPGLCSSAESMVETINKDSISHENESAVDYTDVVVQEKTRGTKKILVVCETMASEIHMQLTGMPLLHDIPVVLCLIENLSSVCSREKFILVFVDKNFDGNFIVEICSIIRFDISSPNKTVAIIGVGSNQSVQISSSQPCALTEVISLPLKEDVITQLLLKYAGIVLYKGLPLTPETPDDDITVARKAEEIIRESEEHCSFLGYNHKDSDKVDSPFNGHTGPSSCYTNSNSNPYTHWTSAPMIQDTSNSRQQSPSINQEQRQSSSVISRELTESFRDKPHSSWSITNEEISQNFPQSILPIPRSYLTQHVTQTYPGQFGNSCQHDRQSLPPALFLAPPQQPTVHVLSPVPTMAQQESIPSSCTSTNQPKDVQTTSDECPEKVSDLNPLSNELKEELPVRNPSYMVSGAPGTKDMKITILPEDMSKHSSKERIRRERIKDSCDKLRNLLPNISGKKTDMASILEMTVKFVKLVKDRVPSTLLEEIGDSLSACTTGMVRKRAQKDLHLPKPKSIRNYTKKHPETLRSRMMPPLPVTVPSVPLTAGDVNHIIYTTFSNNSRPLYPQHGQYYNNGSLQQHNQYLQGLGYNTTCNTICKDIHHNYIHPTHGINQGIPKDIPSLHMHKEPPLYHHNYQPLHSNDVTMCPHKQMYGPPLSMNTSTQWNYMKLPSMSGISPCNSVCLSSNEDPDTTSGSSNASFDSPLWDETRK